MSASAFQGSGTVLAYSASCPLQASCHSLPSGLKALVSGTVQGSFLDDSTSCFELLLEPSAVEVVVHHITVPAGERMSEDGRGLQKVDASSERLAAHGPQAAGSTLARPGLTVLLRCALALWRGHVVTPSLATALSAGCIHTAGG